MEDDLNEDIRAEKILKVLEEAEATEQVVQEEVAEVEEQVSAPEGEKTAPEVPASGESQGEVEPELPAIDPPTTWKTELKATWEKLPRDLQQNLAQWETERNSGVNKKLETAAAAERAAEEAKKASEAAQAEFVRQQQSYAQNLQVVAQQIAAIDPILAEGNRTDWTKLAQENQSEYIRKKAVYDQRVSQVTNILTEQQRVQREAMQAHYSREDQALLTKIPEWKDTNIATKGLTELKAKVAENYGYKPEELQTIADHRLVLIARDALAYHALKAEVEANKAKDAADKEAAKQGLKTKKVVKVPSRPLQPGQSTETKEQVETDRNKAILQRAKGTRSMHERAALIAEIV